MSTTAQINANQQNSKQSTGPRTPEGKAASSQNAITHGFSAADPVLPSEDRSQYNALLERYLSDFAPATGHEEFLVSQMAGARWKLDRLERIETAMFAAYEGSGIHFTTEELIAQAFMEKDSANGFARLDRYRASLERTYHRCARELRATRKEQNKPKSPEIAENKSPVDLTEPPVPDHEERATSNEQPPTADEPQITSNSQPADTENGR